jgi:hypothetical protein
MSPPKRHRIAPDLGIVGIYHISDSHKFEKFRSPREQKPRPSNTAVDPGRTFHNSNELKQFCTFRVQAVDSAQFVRRST